MVYISGGTELLDPKVILKRLGVTSGAAVADLGCGGSGHFIIPAARMVGDKKIVYAVDILKTVLRSVVTTARLEGVNNIKTIWSNLESPGATTIPAGSLDFAFLKNILFQSKKRDAMISEAVRLLRPGGKLLIIDWGKAMTSFGPEPASRVSPDEIKLIAASLNLKLVEEFEAGTYHFGLIFQK